MQIEFSRAIKTDECIAEKLVEKVLCSYRKLRGIRQNCDFWRCTEFFCTKSKKMSEIITTELVNGLI